MKSGNGRCRRWKSIRRRTTWGTSAKVCTTRKPIQFFNKSKVKSYKQAEKKIENLNEEIPEDIKLFLQEDQKSNVPESGTQKSIEWDLSGDKVVDI